MPNTGLLNRVGLSESDLDLPVYRIYNLKRFEQLLTVRTDALVNPSKWEDPFENFFLARTKVFDGAQQISLANLSSDWYGQCWSLNAETDAMWRIYSPDPRVGVKVKSTIRKLFENLKRFGSPAPYLQFYVGRVLYMDQQQILDMMKGLTFSSLAIGGQGEGFAQLLCVKRTAFQHEQEVRLLFQDIEPRRGKGKVLTFHLDPNSLFDEVVLDPRLPDIDRDSVRNSLLGSGCTLPISRSSLYETPQFVIPIE